MEVEKDVEITGEVGVGLRDTRQRKGQWNWCSEYGKNRGGVYGFVKDV